MPRPKEFDPDRAVDAAMDTFWAGGYAATSTQDLCESTGLGRSSLYNTFTSKRELFQRSLRRYADRTHQDQQRMLDSTDPAPEVIRTFLLDAVDTQLASEDRRGCLATNAAVEIGAADAEVAELTRRDFDDLVDVLRRVVERGQREGDIDPARDSTAVARMLHSNLAGIHVVGRVATDRTRLTDIVDAVIDSL